MRNASRPSGRTSAFSRGIAFAISRLTEGLLKSAQSYGFSLNRQVCNNPTTAIRRSTSLYTREALADPDRAKKTLVACLSMAGFSGSPVTRSPYGISLGELAAKPSEGLSKGCENSSFPSNPQVCNNPSGSLPTHLPLHRGGFR